ncbi:hypothetical protein NDU88_000449 [Pleurodeles waltl]|uniref:Uncharacterized protein n=1 Tax=Pleurodeles waltl TaxID=8319 RepID=A0AAV7UQ02_PLEWA|nr:hypothetical protein NDU88_000449 [Pleurodeles waltl]
MQPSDAPGVRSRMPVAPGGTSGASFPDPEFFCSAPRNDEKLDGAGTFKAPEEEQRRPPPLPQNQTTTVMLEKK